MKSILLLITFFSFLSQASEVSITRVVGSVGDYFLTSREVVASHLIDRAIGGEEDFRNDMKRMVNAGLLEKIVALEAESFSVAKLTEGEIKSSQMKLKAKTFVDSAEWKGLEMTSAEVQDLLLRKLRAKKFIQYKIESSTIQVTDAEVKDYFEKNRYKFGNLGIDSFRESIKTFLTRSQQEENLRQWFEVLRRKYKVKNFEMERPQR